MYKQMTLQGFFKFLFLFTGIYLKHVSAAGPHDPQAVAAAARAAAVAARAAATAADAAAAALLPTQSGESAQGALEGIPNHASAASASAAGSQQIPELPLPQHQQHGPNSISAANQQLPGYVSPTNASAATDDRNPLSGSIGIPRATQERAYAVPEPTSTAPQAPASAIAPVDVSAEDNSTFDPRLYLSQQQQQQRSQRQQQWMSLESQQDALLQQLLQQTAVQAWDAYRRQRLDGAVEAPISDFLARRGPSPQ